MTNIELRTVDHFEEPAFTAMVNSILNDPDRQTFRERLFGPAGAKSPESGARQVRVGAFDGETLVGWSHAWLYPGGILYVSNSGVQADRRQQGIYTRLIAAIEEEARALGCSRVESHHRTANSAVLIAKLKAGYTIVGTEFSAEMGLLLKMCKFIDARRGDLFHARAGVVEGTVRHFDSL